MARESRQPWLSWPKSVQGNDPALENVRVEIRENFFSRHPISGRTKFSLVLIGLIIGSIESGIVTIGSL
jgi:hypothetical protein